MPASRTPAWPHPTKKPENPFSDFPLTAHRNGQWCKKIRGKVHCFGMDAAAAVQKYLNEKDDLQAGRQPRTTFGITLADLVNAFLTSSKNRCDSGTISAVTCEDYRRTAAALVRQFGKTVDPTAIRPTEFTKLRNSLAERYAPVRVGKKGVSTGDFSEALQALVGEQAKGLSANVIVKWKETWGQEYDEWMRRDLSEKKYVYLWADGIYAKVRLEDDANQKQCLLVLRGATADAHTESITVLDGYRESTQNWGEVLLDLQQRGLKLAPKLAVGDGSLGFWAALREVFSETREQRCWVHKTANVLNKLPKSVQPKAKADIHEIWQAETRADANLAFDHFLEKYGPKHEAACECLSKDRDALLTFYDFPAAHWKHLRTTNPIESTFARIRLRHRRTKGSGTRRTSLTMTFKLPQSAQKRWRRLSGHALIIPLLEGKPFQDGLLQDAA